MRFFDLPYHLLVAYRIVWVYNHYMKLSIKLILIFIAALAMFSLVILLGLPSLFTGMAEVQMKKQARTFGLFLLKNLEGITAESNLNYTEHEAAVEDLVYKEFQEAIDISRATDSFLVDEIILINPEYSVEVGYPETEKGKDYSSHEDIVRNFTDKQFDIVVENTRENGENILYVDIVAYLKFGREPRVLEIKLDFKQSLAKLKQQFQEFEIISVSASLGIILVMMAALLLLIRNTAIKPVVKISHAMERVGRGDLDVSVSHKSKDEIGMMSRSFNTMVTGLKEKMHLSRYVSRSTIDAVSTAIRTGAEFHKPQRKTITVFFSDIRGFTAFSEKKDPEYIIAILNKILASQTEFIVKHGGYIDKFVGDETMAVFPNPQDAALCALYIQVEMKEKSAGYDGLKLGIGLYEGSVVEGDVGSPETKDYTIIGDTVNTASRLQSVAAGGEILVPESLAADPRISSRFVCKLKGNIKLKGKEKELTLYKITGTRKA